MQQKARQSDKSYERQTTKYFECPIRYQRPCRSLAARVVLQTRSKLENENNMANLTYNDAYVPISSQHATAKWHDVAIDPSPTQVWLQELPFLTTWPPAPYQVRIASQPSTYLNFTEYGTVGTPLEAVQAMDIIGYEIHYLLRHPLRNVGKIECKKKAVSVYLRCDALRERRPRRPELWTFDLALDTLRTMEWLIGRWGLTESIWQVHVGALRVAECLIATEGPTESEREGLLQIVLPNQIPVILRYFQSKALREDTATGKFWYRTHPEPSRDLGLFERKTPSSRNPISSKISTPSSLSYNITPSSKHIHLPSTPSLPTTNTLQPITPPKKKMHFALPATFLTLLTLTLTPSLVTAIPQAVPPFPFNNATTTYTATGTRVVGTVTVTVTPTGGY
ncbi:hypothetical protein G7Y79_00025g057100 [Physcia stellaris]|nr:hypothetical protein G7Y79_00025g057100 [Physcia stellaris]